MAPQEHIPTSANILGTIGTVFWCVQLCPQIYFNWKRKDTEGLPALMLYLWSLCAVPFGVYAIVQNFNIPIQVQPQCFGVLCLITWAQTLVYTYKWRTWTATAMCVGNAVVFGGVEALLILTLRGPYERGVDWPILMIGIIAALLLVGGLIPPYFELWKRNGRVIGINFIFLTIDWNGAFFSLLSLVVQQSFDILGGVLYISCVLMEGGIFISHWIWLLRTRKVRKAAKKAGKTYDEYIATDTADETFGSESDQRNATLTSGSTELANAEKGLRGQTLPEPFSGHNDNRRQRWIQIVL